MGAPCLASFARHGSSGPHPGHPPTPSKIQRPLSFRRASEARQEEPASPRKPPPRGPRGGWPTLTISAYTVHAEGAPSLRLLQGWAALLRALFGFAADTRPNPRGVAIS